MDQIRILVIDDDEEICGLLYQALTEKGHKVKTALDGATGVSICHSFNPHVILLDVMLPGQSGIEVLQDIFDIDNQVKVLMISGMLDLNAAREAIKMGATDYITKPIEFKALDNYITDLVKYSI